MNGVKEARKKVGGRVQEKVRKKVGKKVEARARARVLVWGWGLALVWMSGTGGVFGWGAAGCSDGAGGGGGDLPVSEVITRFDLLAAGTESPLHTAACGQAGLEAGCDVCAALGFYDDGVCDSPLIDAGFCQGPDPDCEAAPDGADLYVAPDGDDENAGTASAPLATLQAALERAAAGDLIYMRGGMYQPTEQTHIRVEGTAEAPIVIQAQPGESVTIDGRALPDGDIDGGSTATWNLDGAKHLRFVGPIHLTHGRGAGVLIQQDTHFVDFVRIESSYNGQRAARAGHGFLIVEAQWADVQDVRFLDCDAHHNANHRVRNGEDVGEHQYQHGDGWRIKSGRNLVLIGCRAWHNLDDGYDLVWATDPILMVDCWAAYTGYDDAEGSITGVPDFAAEWGEGIKLGYDSDRGRHLCVRCLSWRNVHLGFRMDGGPNTLLHCASFQNGRRALGWSLGSQAHVIRNSLDFDTYRDSTIPESTDSRFNTWDAETGVTVTAEDFRSTDDSGMLGPRNADGSLPQTDFLRLVSDSDLIDAGTTVGLPHGGSAPDLGCFERY
jgi:hypothetical protein